MSYVFISYAHEDRGVARNIQQNLERVNIPVWWDEKLQLRQKFVAPIENALYGADAVLVLWSLDSIESEWVQREAEIGDECDTLIHIFLDDVYPPVGSEEAAGIDLAGWNPGQPNSQFDRLVRGLREIVTGGEGDGEWNAERVADDTLVVSLDQDDHTLQYTGGRLYVDGEIVRAQANPLDYDRSFDFDLSDGPDRYVCNLVVNVSAFRGSVKRMTLSIGGSVIYDE